MEDLSSQHRRLSDVFDFTAPPEQYRLEDAQITSFHETGFLKGVRVLTPEHVDRLRDELEPLLDPSNPLRGLFHEYHANESADPDRILVHALGAWRITPAFHDQRDTFQPVPMTLERGAASFHHPLTVHGSLPNTSPHPRRAVALNFCLDGTKSATNEPLLDGVPVIPEGEPLGGQFFPLVYDPSGL